MPNDVTGVLIDFVGTLVSFKPDPGTALLEMHAELTRRRVNVTPRQLGEAYEAAHAKYQQMRHEQLIEVSNEIWVHDALEQLGLGGLASELPLVLTDAYFRAFVNGASVLPGVEETLDYLRRRGYRLAVVSNFSYAPVPERLLRRFGLDRFFDAVIISGNIGYRKPHPEIFERAARALGIRHESAVMVGDTQTEDVFGARKAGMKAYQLRESLTGYYTPYRVVGVEDEKFLRPDAVIGSFSELRQLL